MATVSPSSSSHPVTWKFGYRIYHAETRDQVRCWLAENHASEKGVWLCSWRTPTAGPRCPSPEINEEAICFGWIDSTVNTLDDDRGLKLLTPRRAKSSWTRLNRRRVAEMETAGLMTDAGRRAVQVARDNGWWSIYDQVEDLIEPDQLREALDANPSARLAWDGFPPSARKMMLWSVVSAAQDSTRRRRIATIVAKAELGQRV
ncbi:MAG: YdeI/OmpD-associated family protein [Candidatus Nanopelagicales bacterium]|jgi:uncharacterized protein YdeI (YjbR/CyaY-like superfamily)